MSDKINLTSMIATLSKTVDFNEFYHIGIEPHRSRISLQGTINSYTIGVAKKLNVELVFDNSSEMLKGESEDDKLRIVLT